MRKFIIASLLVSLCILPNESEAQFFKKIGNAIENAVNSVANKADCWFSTAPCDGGFMSCKIKIDKGGGNYTGGWARKKYPRTVFNSHNNLSLSEVKDSIRTKVQKGYQNEDSHYDILYQETYKNIFNSGSTILDPTNCDPYGRTLCNASQVAKNAAFVYLMGCDTTGANLQNPNGYRDKAIQILEQFKTSIPINTVAMVDGGYPDYLIEHSKDLVHFMQAYDLLRGAGVSEDDLKCAMKNLQKYAKKLHKRATGALGPYTVWNNNASLMIAGSLGLSAIVLHESSGGFLGNNKNSKLWMKKALKNTNNIFGLGTIFNPTRKASDNKNKISGYAEGPHYFQYAMHNCLPFFMAQYNYHKTPSNVNYAGLTYHKSSPFNYKKAYFKNPVVKNLFQWFEAIKMEDGDYPAFDHSWNGLRFVGAVILRDASLLKSPIKVPSNEDDVDIRADFLAAINEIGIGNLHPQRKYDKAFEHSGNLIIKRDYHKEEYERQTLQALFENDVALNGGNHEERDNGSFIVSSGGFPLIIDPSYLGYESSAYTASSKFHNTITFPEIPLDQNPYLDFDWLIHEPKNINYGNVSAELKATAHNVDAYREFVLKGTSDTSFFYIIKDRIYSNGGDKKIKFNLNGNGVKDGKSPKTFINDSTDSQFSRVYWEYPCHYNDKGWGIMATVSTDRPCNIYTETMGIQGIAAGLNSIHYTGDANLTNEEKAAPPNSAKHTRLVAEVDDDTLIVTTTLKPYKCGNDKSYTKPLFKKLSSNNSTGVLIQDSNSTYKQAISFKANGNKASITDPFNRGNSAKLKYKGNYASLGMKFNLPSINSNCTINSFFRDASLDGGTKLEYHDTTYIQATKPVDVTYNRKKKYKYKGSIHSMDSPTVVTFFLPEIPDPTKSLITISSKNLLDKTYDTTNQLITATLDSGQYNYTIHPTTPCITDCFFPPNVIDDKFLFSNGGKEHLGHDLDITDTLGHLKITKGSDMVICPDFALTNFDRLTMVGPPDIPDPVCADGLATSGETVGGDYKYTSPNKDSANLTYNRSRIIVKPGAELILENESFTRVGVNSTIIIENGATFHIKNGAELVVGSQEIPGYGEVIVKDGGNLCVEPNANIKFFKHPTDSTDKNVFYISHSNSPHDGAIDGVNYQPQQTPVCIDFCNFKSVYPTHGIGNPSYGWMNVAKPEAHLSVPDKVCEGNSVPADARGSLNDTRYEFSYCLYDTAANDCKDAYKELITSGTDTMPCLNEIIDLFSFGSQYFDTGNFYSIKLKVYNDCGHWDTTHEVFEYIPRPRAIATGPDTICSGVNQITVDGSQSFGDYDSAQWQVYKEDQMLLKDTFSNEIDTFRVMRDTIYQPDTSLIDTVKVDTMEISGLPANDSTLIKKFKRYINYFEGGNVTDTIIHSSNIDSISFPNFEFKANQKYKVKLTLFGYCGPAKDTHSIYVHPVEIDAGPDKIIHEPSLNGNDTVTLEGTGEGGNDYSWSPTQGLSSPDTLETEVEQDATTDYVLSATNDFGCNVSDTATVYYNTLAYAGADKAICLGDAVQLGTNPDPDYEYRWSTGRGLSDSTIANPIASPDTSIKYTMYVIDWNNDTVEFDHVKVNIDNQVDPFVINESEKSVPLGTELALNPTNSNKFTNYQWFHNGDTISGAIDPVYVPTEGGEYFLMGKWVCGTDTQWVRSNPVWVQEECEDIEYDSYPEGKVFREDKELNEKTIYFGDDVIIKPGVEVQINNSDIYMAPCTRIIVQTNRKQGGILELDNTSIQGCGKWKGIYVEGIPQTITTDLSPHAHLYMDGNSENKNVIEDALVGVYVNHGAKFQAKNYKFRNNHIHVAIRNGNYEFDSYGQFNHYPYIKNCEFGYTLKGMPNCTELHCEEEPCFSAFREPLLNKMIYIEETQFFEIENNLFSETYIGKNRTAISGYEVELGKIHENSIEGSYKFGYLFDTISNSSLLNESFSDPSTTKEAGIKLSYSDTVNLNDLTLSQKANFGLSILKADSMSVNKSNFYGNMNYGINFKESENIVVNDNEFITNDSLKGINNGIYLKNIKGGTVVNNYFENLEAASIQNSRQKGIGLQAYLSGAYEKPIKISNNDFSRAKYGIVLSPQQYPVVEKSWINWGWHTMNVNLTCNTFTKNDVGILGSGNIKDQVYDSIGAANSFNQSLKPDSSSNKNYDILWNGIDPGVFAYYHDSGSYAPNSDTNNLAKNGVMINGYDIYKSDHFNVNVNSVTNCGSLNKKGHSSTESIIADPSGSLKVYPNPFKEELIVEANKPLKHVTVKDMLGRTIVKKTGIGMRKIKINSDYFAEGFYIIQAFDQNMNRLTNKVLKVE